MIADVPTRLVAEDPPQRYALRFESSLIKGLIPAGSPGVYMLYDGTRASYIGRSDRCLRQRLLGHPLRRHATHVCWQTVSTPEQAFRLESIWFHDLAQTAPWNAIHPAKPAGSTADCPACWAADARKHL